MRRVPYLLFMLLLAASCSSTSKLPRPEIQPEFLSSNLNANGIVAISPDYKQSYFRRLPYLFVNESETFNEIQGDFYNVKFNVDSNLNIMPGFWSDYGTYQNSLIVLIVMSGTSTLPIKDIPISVVSSKHGVFEREKLIGNNQINEAQQRVLFVKKLALTNRFDVLNKINDDVLIVKIDGQLYKFLNPEIKLD
ncbi:hypothetical protein FK220_012495 [Flavobacteriaceae bacterium TP-CH-4]|uniref:Uncharacterized protein n=1 Tax=Pelagihabitans pacificus TaxID=2696054 RepID=A0A967EEA1_9FLAO|nr:hypothetical protein [Pelagihabitans pacificus]NHF60168.1 hypothetical protein [Pelagihabitans pacificus]